MWMNVEINLFRLLFGGFRRYAEHYDILGRIGRGLHQRR